MDIKQILAKAAKGETLTDEEKSALAAFDPDRVADSKAAAARKTAEQKLKEKEDALKALQTEIEAIREEADHKANANKPELDKLTAQLAKVQKQLDDQKKAFETVAAEKRALVRGTKLDRIMGGLKFVDGLDASLPRLALEKALADLKDEDLDTDDLVKPIVEGFTSKNKAILLDASGGGAGTPAKGGAGASTGGKPIDKMTPEERRADMKKQGII